MINPIVFDDMKDVYARRSDWSWLNGKSVMVTGPYGMLASYIVYFLIFLNEEIPGFQVQILACGRSETKLQARFGEYCNRSYFHAVHQDLCKQLEIEDPVDYIFHAASLASSQYYSVDPTGTLLPNSVGTYQLLELAREKNTRGFLFLSSGDVYGMIPPNLLRITEHDFGSLDPMEPRNCYGESKRMGENMCKAWYLQYGVPTKVVRLGHTYGPTMDLEHDCRVFAEFTKNVLAGEDIIMKSDGSATRGFCYLADALDAFFLVLKDGVPGEAYNVYNDWCVLSMRELAEILVALRPEKQLKVVVQQREQNSAYMESLVKKAPGLTSDKLRNLGWETRFDARAGFERTLESFERNETI